MINCGHDVDHQIDDIKKDELVSVNQNTDRNSNKQTDWINLESLDSSFLLMMPYATENNFLKEKIYPCATCYLRTDAAQALLQAQKEALTIGLRLVLYDCYRPLPLQQKMYDIIPDTRYVANPKEGSKHNKGVAVDAGLANVQGTILDMGTAFDDFSESARFNARGISVKAKKNRKQLRDIMLAHDFVPYENEWWHFHYKNTNYPNADFVWKCDD